jgi:hypothetical protein
MLTWMIFMMVCGMALGFEDPVAHGSDSQVLPLAFDQVDIDVSASAQESALTVYLQKGIHTQHELECLIRPDGLVLRDDDTQYMIPRKNIVRIAVDVREQAKINVGWFSRWRFPTIKKTVPFVVIGYVNSAQKLKVLTLQVPGLSADTEKKLYNLI